jgi:exopolysaccharide biosynthesis polyprenyl glycosylphosphotransferase
MLLAFALHGELREIVPLLRGTPRFEQYATLAYLTLPIMLLLIVATKLHRVFERNVGRAQLLFELFRLHMFTLAALVLLLFVTQVVINRSLIALFLGCTFVVLYVERSLMAAWHRYKYRRGHGQTRLLLVGEPTEAMLGFVQASQRTDFPPRIVGYLDVDTDTDQPQSESNDEDLLPRRGHLDDFESFAHREAVDQVVFFPPISDPSAAPAAVRACRSRGLPTCFAFSFAKSFGAMPHVLSLYDHLFISVEAPNKSPGALAVKHGVDVIAAVLVLVIGAPVLLFAAAGVLLTMGRPIFFLQDRAGKNGKRFRILKFRTMTSGAEEERDQGNIENEMSGPVFKATNDPRVTRFGRFLRRTSIDELPQVINVLTGTMSLVGPRPLPVSEQQNIQGAARRRLSMKPGITGIWQVSGRSNIDFDQ